MARAMTPGRRKHAENKYFEPGIGRKTGITLKDTGIRDEHGLEPLDGIFSSPAKSATRTVRNGNTTLTSSDMAIQQSPAPEPTELLNLRKTPKFPPRGQSPIKTHLNTSPRRQSSARPTSHGDPGVLSSPSRVPSQVARAGPNRLLDFSTHEVRQSVDGSPERTKGLRTETGRPRSDIFGKSPEVQVGSSVRSLVALKEEEGVAQKTVVHEETTILPNEDETYFVHNGDDSLPHLDADDTAAETQLRREFPESVRNAGDATLQSMGSGSSEKRKRGRPRKSDMSTSSVQDTSRMSISGTMRSNHNLDDSQISQSIELILPEAQAVGPPEKKRRGRPPKNKIPVHQDAEPSEVAANDSGMLTVDDGDEALEEERPSKRPRSSDAKAQPAKKKGKSKLKPPPSERDPNAMVRPAKPHNKPKAHRATSIAASPSRHRRAGSSANVQYRANTPFEDAGTNVTRSGRPSVKPLQYWLNESYVWRNGEVDGIVRAEEVEQPKVRKAGKRRNTKMPILREEDEEEEEEEEVGEEDGKEDWEDEVGVIKGYVTTWDSELNMAGNEEDEEDIAFAARSMVLRDVQGADFRYAKVLTMPFFGSGLVELPARGYKRMKNSRKMQMVFFVHEGKVTVEVAGLTFGLTKGGCWQVPRGNTYAIMNESHTRPAKVFFAQGCEITAGGDGA
ncbi:mitotic fidelity of chromosome transmission-related protein [Elasticomyces elasticus]|nr:mitotic fidelity of chromosome transmission-related protein [Elasticomyces elasticus]